MVQVARGRVFTITVTYLRLVKPHTVASMELKDFSRFEEDEFGNYVIVPRRKSKRPSYPVLD
jgi:hypothetical protein